MKRVLKASRMLLLGISLLLGAASPVCAAEELALIVSAHSNIEQLQSPLVRRLFLGFNVTQHGMRLRPVLNEADPQIKELFLQNIVSMSDSTYDRYVLRLALLQGLTQPMVYKSNAELLDAVAADPTVVGYVLAKDGAHDARVRILRIVWHD
jgi:hypothetical protein